MPAKFCLFCGEAPLEKTKEHVLPTWLIQLTGDPSRVASFGLDLSKGVENARHRQFAFSQFHFPACKICNGAFGLLEDAAKPIIEKMLAREILSAWEMSKLLDWLDKVRLGLWLGFHQLDRNFENIRPRFHTRQRIGQKDRLVIVAYGEEGQKRLSFFGPWWLSFRWVPSAFGLVINNLFLVNVSSEHLLARRLGFPYPPHPAISLGPHKPDYTELVPGLNRVLRPVFLGPLQLSGTSYYQPMFPSEMQGRTRTLYENAYVTEHSLDQQSGVGDVYCVRGDRFGWINSRVEPWYRATDEMHRVDADKKAVLSVISALQYIIRQKSPSFELSNEKERAGVQMRKELSIEELGHLREAVRSWPEGRDSVKPRA